MKKLTIALVGSAICFSLLCGCDSSKPADTTAPETTVEVTEANYELLSNSEKATMKADKEFKTVIQITNTYPNEICCVFEDPEIASCEWAQWVGNKGALMFTGLKKGETTLTIYAGVENGDIKTAKNSLTVHVIVEDEPTSK